MSSQAQDIILNGGDPTEMFKDNIKYFGGVKRRHRRKSVAKPE